VANQNKKNRRRQERTTCNPNENPGPVNKIRTVQEHRIINARQERTTCNPNENPGPVNKIRTVQEHRIINAMALRVLSFIIGFITELCEEGSCGLFLPVDFFIGLLGE